jgi:hypothetical protein
MARNADTPRRDSAQVPIHHFHGPTANEAFVRYSALQIAWAKCPSLEDDPRFVEMRNEARSKFCQAFGVFD